MLGHSIVSQYFMEPEGSIPNSQGLSTCSYPEPDQSYTTLLVLIMICIFNFSFHLEELTIINNDIENQRKEVPPIFQYTIDLDCFIFEMRYIIAR
jgi:hypothetical protein